MAKSPEADDGQARIDGLTEFESKLVNLLALLVSRERTQAEQVSLLHRAGFRSAEIATLLDTTPNTVSVTLVKQKKARVGGRKRPRR